MDLSSHIKDLITAATEMKKAVGVDKKWLNKTIARLEEAQIFATLIVRKGSLSDQPEALPTGGCTCIHGAISANCPIHTSTN